MKDFYAISQNVELDKPIIYPKKDILYQQSRESSTLSVVSNMDVGENKTLLFQIKLYTGVISIFSIETKSFVQILVDASLRSAVLPISFKGATEEDYYWSEWGDPTERKGVAQTITNSEILDFNKAIPGTYYKKEGVELPGNKYIYSYSELNLLNAAKDAPAKIVIENILDNITWKVTFVYQENGYNRCISLTTSYKMSDNKNDCKWFIDGGTQLEHLAIENTVINLKKYSDLNNLTKPGTWQCDLYVTGKTIKNLPKGIVPAFTVSNIGYTICENGEYQMTQVLVDFEGKIVARAYKGYNRPNQRWQKWIHSSKDDEVSPTKA